MVSIDWHACFLIIGFYSYHAQLLEAKQADPSRFASWWEMDEQDIDEATEEQIQSKSSDVSLWFKVMICIYFFTNTCFFVFFTENGKR